MKDTMETFEKNNVTTKLEDNNASLKFVHEAIEEFELSTTKFMAKLEIVKAQRTRLDGAKTEISHYLMVA